MSYTAKNKADNPMLRMTMSFGVSTGLWIGAKFILNALSINHAWVGIVVWLVDLYILFLFYSSTLIYRFREKGGNISFSEAYSFILLLMFFSAIIAAAVRWIYLSFFDSSYLSLMYEQTMPVLEKMMPAEIDEVEMRLREFLVPIRFSLFYIFYDLIVASVLGLILAPIVRRSKNILPDDFED